MMFNTMNASIGSIALWHHVHMLFGAALIVGLILLTIWAAKYLKKDHMQSWIWGLLIIGVLGWLLTASSSSFWYLGRLSGTNMMGGILECAQDGKCLNAMDTMMDQMMDHR